MAHLADELAHDDLNRRSEAAAGRGGLSVPEIVNDPRQLRIVPWHGEGPDPLDAQDGA